MSLATRPPAAGAAHLEPPAARRRGPDAWRRFRRNRGAMAGAVVIFALVLVAAFADVLAPYSPSQQFLLTPAAATGDPLAERDTGKWEAPSRAHLFGTDHLARDILSRTLVGLRLSLAAAAVAIVVVTVLGVTVGTLAGAGARWLDAPLMRATDVAYAFPDLLLIILVRAAFGDSLFGRQQLLGVDASIVLLFLAISLAAWPTMARLVRGQLLVARETEFALAAHASGASKTRVALRHLLPTASTPVVVEATFLVPRAIVAEAALSFIGIGVAPPSPSLGALIRDHFDFVALQWTALAIPTLLLAVIFLAFQLAGDGLREALDPRAAR